ncbi:nickel transport protein, partial [Mesorhizobium australicum]
MPGNAPVTLRDGGGKIVAEERTDSNGRFALLAPIRTDLTVIVDAKDGHVARFDIPAAHLPDTLPAGDDERNGDDADGGAGNRKPADAYAAASADEIDAVVARQIAPLPSGSIRSNPHCGCVIVLGGLGYIVGIFGLIAFLKARHRAPDKSAP